MELEWKIIIYRDVGTKETTPPLCKGRGTAIAVEGLAVRHLPYPECNTESYNPSVSFADSSLYTREPLHR